MKTKEELNAPKEEVETLNKKLAELSENELKQVSSGAGGIDLIDRPKGTVIVVPVYKPEPYYKECKES